MVKGLKKSAEEWLRELGLLIWRKGGLAALYNHLKGGWRQVGVFFQVASDSTRGNNLNLHQTRFRLVVRIISLWKGWSGLGIGC